MHRLVSGLSLAALLSVLPASAGAAVILDMGTAADCVSGGCFSQSKHYTRTFSASDLGGPRTIRSLSFAKALLGDYQDRMITINFYNADGSLAGSLGSFTVAVLGGDVVTLSGPGFDWNPGNGDLTARITIADWAPPGGWPVFAGGGGGGGFFLRPAAASAPPAPETSFFSAPDDSPDSGGGLASSLQPLVSPPSASADDLQLAVTGAPEPGAWALMITGFGLAGATLRRRRTVLG